MIEISSRKIAELDMSFLEEYFHSTQQVKDALKTEIPQIEHYRLLTHLSFLFNDTLIIDAGTCNGMSAVCLAQNPRNKVVSYDIFKKDFNKVINPEVQHTPFGQDYPNLSFKLSDISLEYSDILNEASLIVLDIAHDGEKEKVLSGRLADMGFDGYILCDDVIGYHVLTKWFYNLPWDKYDLTRLGHAGWGTGFLDCGRNGVDLSDNNVVKL